MEAMNLYLTLFALGMLFAAGAATVGRYGRPSDSFPDDFTAADEDFCPKQSFAEFQPPPLVWRFPDGGLEDFHVRDWREREVFLEQERLSRVGRYHLEWFRPVEMVSLGKSVEPGLAISSSQQYLQMTFRGKRHVKRMRRAVSVLQAAGMILGRLK